MSLILGHNDLLGPWVYAHTGGQWLPGSGQTIGWWDGTKVTAAFTFTQYNGRNIFVDLAVEDKVTSRAFWYAGFSYVFEQLKCTRLTLVVEASNLPSVKLMAKLGATLEATLAGAARDGGDTLIFRLTQDCTIWKKLNGKVNRYAGHPRSGEDHSPTRSRESSSFRADNQRDAANGDHAAGDLVLDE